MVFLKKIVPRQIKSKQQKTRLLRFLRYGVFEEDSTKANQEQTTKNQAFTFSTLSRVCYAMHFFFLQNFFQFVLVTFIVTLRDDISKFT